MLFFPAWLGLLGFAWPRQRPSNGIVVQAKYNVLSTTLCTAVICIFGRFLTWLEYQYVLSCAENVTSCVWIYSKAFWNVEIYPFLSSIYETFTSTHLSNNYNYNNSPFYLIISLKYRYSFLSHEMHGSLKCDTINDKSIWYHSAIYYIRYVSLCGWKLCTTAMALKDPQSKAKTFFSYLPREWPSSDSIKIYNMQYIWV